MPHETRTEEDNRLLREKLEKANETLRQQKSVLDAINLSPAQLAEITAITQDALILNGNLELPLPQGLSFQVGDMCRLSPTGGISGVSKYRPLGPVVSVKSVEGGIAIVETPAGSLAFDASRFKALRPGDRVVLDRTGFCILRVLPLPESELSNDPETKVTWDMIGGAALAKKALQEAVELPFQHEELYRLFCKKPPKGVLLHGRPGNGKSLLAKAVSTSLRHTHKGKGGSTAFLSIRGPEVLSKWVGESEATIRDLFARAEQHYEQHGYPAVIFVDEADALLGRRGSDRISGMERTIVPQFLTLMDGLRESHTLIILATNRADTIDQAVLREGRVDRKVYVPPPSRQDAAEVLEIHTRELPFKDAKEEVLKTVVSWIYDPNVRFYETQTGDGTIHLTLGDLASGAMLAGIVDRATSSAISRSIKGAKSPKGLILQDFLHAINDMIAENTRTRHTEILEEFCQLHKVQVHQVKTCTPQPVKGETYAEIQTNRPVHRA